VGYNNYVGDIAEIIVYNTSLSGSDQTNLQNYLSSKWLTGLSPSITQPFTVVAPVYSPKFGGFIPQYVGGTLSSITFSGSNGPTSGQYRVLASTNASAPVSIWTPVLTNAFDPAGTFNFTVPIAPNVPVLFYQLAAP
jgi:hypothetical protein